MNGDRMHDADQGRWVTYAEAGALLGVSAQAARMLAKRRGWARRTPNAHGDRALVLLPAEALVRPPVQPSVQPTVQPRAALDPVHTGNEGARDQVLLNGSDRLHERVNDQPPDQVNGQVNGKRSLRTVAVSA
jgi:hypothetical protein